MTADPQPAPRKPVSGPEPVGRDERAAFEALVRQSLPTVRSSAQAWRNGLTALITLATAGVAVQGRNVSVELMPAWRAVVTLLIGAGLAAAGAGLWQALSAEAGTRTVAPTLTEIHSRHASVAAFEVALAGAAAVRLRRARNAVAVAFALLLVGVLVTWWAPPKKPDPPAYVAVTHPGGTSCGVLRSADGGLLRLTVVGAHQPVVVSLADVSNIAVVATCP